MDQQEQSLRKQLQENQQKLEMLTELKQGIRNVESFSVDSLGDVAQVMKNQKKRKRILARMVLVGILMDIMQMGTVLLFICTDIWWPLAVGLPLVIAMGVVISVYYHRSMVYICPACHKVFHPKFWPSFWSAHTPNTRHLTCPDCGHWGFCMETCKEE